jgi:pseudaminic acid cytidylyltransferase
MNTLCVIPARGGSKRIPKKNIRDFCGKPAIAWSIEAARQSGCFDRIVVSTDDEEIAQVAGDWGAEVPFMRPPELSDDLTATRPVVNHAIRQIENDSGRPDYVCCLYATAVFVHSEDLQSALEMVAQPGVDFAFSVTSFPYPIQRALRITQENRVEMFHPEYRLSRSQDLENAYHDAGQFYWGKGEAFLEEKPTFGPNSVPIALPRFRVQDLDTLEDWQRAELMFATLQQL